jgi:hypothetical protein
MTPKLDPRIAAQATAKPIAPVNKSATASPATKLNQSERMQQTLVGKFFYFVFASGTRYRAGKIEALVSDSSIAVRYFYLDSGRMQKWQHIVKMYDQPRIDNLTGFWLYDNEEDLKSDHQFLLDHLASQELLLEQEKVATPKGENE